MMTKGAMGEDGGCWGAAPGSERGASHPALGAGRRKPAPFPPAPPKEMGRGDAAKMDGAPQNGWWESTAAPSPPPGQGTWP